MFVICCYYTFSPFYLFTFYYRNATIVVADTLPLEAVHSCLVFWRGEAPDARELVEVQVVDELALGRVVGLESGIVPSFEQLPTDGDVVEIDIVDIFRGCPLLQPSVEPDVVADGCSRVAFDSDVREVHVADVAFCGLVAFDAAVPEAILEAQGEESRAAVDADVVVIDIVEIGTVQCTDIDG